MGESINQPRPRDQQCYGTQTNNRDYPWSKQARTVFSCYLKLIIWASTFVYLQRTKKYYWKRKTLVVGTIQRKFRRRNMTSKAVQHQRSRITLCSLRKVNPVTYSRNWKKKSALCYHIYRLRHLQHDEICTLHKTSHLSYATHKNSLIKYSTTSTACCSESTSNQSIINKIFLCVWFLTSEYLHRMGQTEIVTATLKSWPCIPIKPSSILFRNWVYSD